MASKIYPSMPQESVMKTYDKNGNLISAVPVTYGAHGHAQPLPGGPSYDWGDPPRYSSSSDDSSNYNDYYTSYGGAAATVGFEHVGFTAVSKRNFTIKVLLTVTAMVSVMIGMTFWFLYDYSIGCYLTSEWWLYYVFTLAVPLVGLVIFCSDTLTRRWPLNLFVLIFWTFIMSTGYAFLANLWAVNSLTGNGASCKNAFCAAKEADCSSGSPFCRAAEECTADAAGTMGISLGVVAVVLLIGVCLAICKIDIYDIGWPLQVIFILLLLPCGFIGLIFLPYEWYFGFVCSLMIYMCVIGIWNAMYLITSSGGFHQDEWVRAAMYIFHLERSSFDYFEISLEESFLERP